MTHALRGGGHSRHIEFEPVEFACAHAGFEGFLHVERVGPCDFVGACVECVGDGEQQFVLGFRVGLRQQALRASCGVALCADRRERVGTDCTLFRLWIRHSLLP